MSRLQSCPDRKQKANRSMLGSGPGGGLNPQANTLWYGDNLEVLRQMDGESVDLIYLDPPFKSDKKYNVLYSTPDGKGSPAQMQAFDDTWKWDEAAVENLGYVMAHGGRPRPANIRAR